MLSALFCSLHIQNTPPENVPQPILVIVENTMPLYKLIGEKYCRNTEVIEVLHLSVRFVSVY